MEQFTSLRNRILGMITALLILVQTVFAAGWLIFDDAQKDRYLSQKTEIKEEVPAKASYAVVDTRITLALFLYFWLVREFTLDVPLIAYDNCKAFFVNPHFFHVFYTCLSALAP